MNMPFTDVTSAITYAVQTFHRLLGPVEESDSMSRTFAFRHTLEIAAVYSGVDNCLFGAIAREVLAESKRAEEAAHNSVG